MKKCTFKKNAFYPLAILLLIGCEPYVYTQDKPLIISQTSSDQITVNGILEALGASAYDLIHKFYDSYKTYLHRLKLYVTDATADQTVEAILLVITPQVSVTNLSEVEKEHILRKQARLFTMKDRVVARLRAQLTSHKNIFSPAHQQSISGYIDNATLFCNTFDAVRNDNPYEKEYECASFLDTYVEKKIVNSIILSCKPDEECALDELQEKAILKKRADKVMHKLTQKVKGAMLDSITSTGMFFIKLFI